MVHRRWSPSVREADYSIAASDSNMIAFIPSFSITVPVTRTSFSTNGISSVLAAS